MPSTVGTTPLRCTQLAHCTSHTTDADHCIATHHHTAVAGLGGGWGDAGPHRTQGDTGPHRAGGVRVARARLCGAVLRIALGHIGLTRA